MTSTTPRRDAPQRHPDDPLTSEQCDAVVLRAIAAGSDLDGVRAALAQAREDMRLGLTFDADGALRGWAF